MKKKKKTNEFLEALYKQYKVVVSNDKIFEERLSFKTTKFGVFLVALTYTSILIGVTAVLIYSEIKEEKKNKNKPITTAK